MTITRTRAEWGARPPKSVQAIGTVRGVALHYSGSASDEQADHANCAGRVRGIQRYHMDTRGWADVAYNFLACLHGTVFEGRGFGHRSAAQGTNDGNAHYLAVCFLGNDSAGRDDVTDAGRAALRYVVDQVRDDYLGAREVRPHSSFHATACPGDELRAWIAQGMPASAQPSPEPAPPPAPPGHSHALPMVRVRDGRGQVFHPEAGRWFTQQGTPWWEFADVQTHLHGHGLDSGPVDGIGGPRTDRAIRAFQRRRGLAPDGVVGPNTWRRLHA
ncbi:MAG: peptidoglycan recognition protein family protein [Candidatus Methylomirabilales bacterium]